MSNEENERYEYIKAIVDDAAEKGSLRWEWRLVGSWVRGHQSHDESVSGWTDTQIIQLTCDMLDVPDDNRDAITVEHW